MQMLLFTKDRIWCICKTVTFWAENSQVSFFLLFIANWKEKGDYQKLAHLFLLGAPWLHWDFSSFHTRNYKATKLRRIQLISKRIPQQPHGRAGKTSGTGSQEQTRLYGFMAASQFKAHLVGKGEAGRTMRRLHFCHSCCGMARINHRAEVRTASP